MEFRDFISELKSRADIVSVIGRYVTLERRGNQFWACCPFHHEKTPSFSINQIQQYYYCFGCKETGDVIKFVQKMDGVDFMDAVKKLADIMGMEMPKTSNDDSGLKKAERDKHLALLKATAKHYYSNLSTSEGQVALEYLLNRGLSRNTITTFGMGYSLDGETIIRHLRGLGYTVDDMKTAGLIVEYEGRTYDPFYGRVIIPIINRDGNVIGFGGRTLKPDEKRMKYRNSPDNPLFNKRNVLFGINQVIKHHREEKFDSIIVVEGYMDVISLYQCGVKNAVASMGTALTSSQARQLRNLVDNVYICYDGDFAGRNATLSGLDILKEAGLNVKVVSLPDGKDPDDVAKQGLKAFKELLDKSMLLYDYKLAVCGAEFDLKISEEKIKYAVKAVSIISELDNEIEREHYLGNLSQITGYSKEHLKRQLVAVDEAKSKQTEIRVEIPVELRGSELNLAVNYILKCALDGVTSVDSDIEACLETATQQKIYKYLQEQSSLNKKPQPSDLFTVLDEEEHRELSEVLMAENSTFKSKDEAVEYLISCKRRISVHNLSAERAKLLDVVLTASKEERNSILLRIKEIDRELKSL